MHKRLVRAKPLAHLKIFAKNIAHLTGLVPAWTALSFPPRSPAAAHFPDSRAARAFAAHQLPHFEAALAAETCGLLPELPGHAEALVLAAGVHGTSGLGGGRC